VSAALALCATLALSLLRSVSAGLAELRRVGAIDFGWLFRATKSAGLALLFLSITGAAQAQEIIAGWDFQTTTTGGTAVLASPNTQTVFNANVGSGTLYLNGSEGSSSWASATELNAFGGTATNAVNGLSSVTTSPSALAVLGGTGNAANGKAISFKFSMTGKKDLQISFAAQRTSTGFSTLVWEFSTNGATWTSIGTISSGSAAGTLATSFATSGVLSLPTVTGLDNVSNAFVRLTFSGATASSGNNRLDNFRFMASPVGGGTVPDAPTITAITPGDGSLSVAFTPPASNGGAAISNYEYSTDGTTYVARSPAATNSPLTISGLNNGTTYPVTLKAVNSLGAGTASASVNGTPAAVLNPPVITATNFSGTVGVAFSQTIQASGSPTNFTLVSGTLPGGLTFNSNNGTITGTPTNAITNNLTVSAANSAGTSSNATIGLAIAKGSQTITFGTLANRQVGDAPFTLSATVNSALPISYSSSSNSVATVSNNTVTIVGAGTTTITASQAGNENWNAATNATQTLTVVSAVNLPHTDSFTQTAGTFLVSTNQTAEGWSNLNTGDGISIASGNLTFSGLPASVGNKIAFDGAGMDAAKLFTKQTNGTVYWSFLLNIPSLGSLNTTGGYIAGFTEGTSSTFGATVWARQDGTGYDLGINPRTTAANTQWTTGTTTTNTTLFVVISYELVSATGNDVVKMWINPALNGTVPEPTLTATNTGGTDLADLSRIFLRQDGGTATPFVEMDEFRISTLWADAVPAASIAPVISNFSPSSGTEGTSVTINGANFGASPTVKFNGTSDLTATVNGAGTQITATVPSGATTGKITVEVTGQPTATSATDFTVTVLGGPSLSLSPSGITGLTNFAGQASASTNYTVTGTNLGGTNLVVTASTNAIEVSTNASTGFTNTLTLAPAGDGTLTNTLWVRVSAEAVPGAVSGTISHVSGAASAVLSVSGTAATPALSLTLATNSVPENGGANATTGTVGIPFSRTNDLTVTLTSTNTAAATVPATVVITNGQTNATFAIAAVANTNSFSSSITAIQANATNYTQASTSLTVTNTDVPPTPLAAKGWINEFHYDPSSNPETGEFVEIVLAPGISNDVSLVFYNGGSSAASAAAAVTYTVTPLGGTSLAAIPFASLTAGETTSEGYRILSVVLADGSFQNGSPDGLALIIDGVVEEFVSYEGVLTASNGAAAGYTSTDCKVSETQASPGTSIQRVGPGATGRDFTWIAGATSSRGNANASQNLGATGVQGTGVAAIVNSTPSSPLVGANIFPRNETNQTVSVSLTGTLSSGTISALRITVPSSFTGLNSTNQISVTGTGGAGAVFDLQAQAITVTGLTVDQVNTATVNISGLTTPETAGSLSNDGNYAFTVETGTDGSLQALLLQPAAIVVIPMAHLGDVDANGVTLDAGKTVAVQAVCTEENFNSSSSTSAYLQSGQPDGTNKAGINVYSGLRNLFARGDEYVVSGSILNYSGLTEIVVSSSNQVVRLGTASSQPTPVTLTLAQLTDAHEAYEGSLVRVVGLSKATNGGTWALTSTTNTNGTVTTSGANIILQNGGTNLTARLNVGSTALTEPIYPAAITGIYGQFVASAPFVGGGQIQPRDQADIEDAAALKLTLGETQINEGGDFTSTTLTIERTVGTSGAVNGTLAGVPSGKVRVQGTPSLDLPYSFTIPDGQASVQLTIEAIDNGTYSGDVLVGLTASDDASALVSGTASLTVLEDEVAPPSDTTPPVITLNGDNPLTVLWGLTWVDDYSAFDAGDNASVTVNRANPVDTKVPGNYTVTYTATDSKSNTATATRTVNVRFAGGGTNRGPEGLPDAVRFALGADGTNRMDSALMPTSVMSNNTLVLNYHGRPGTTPVELMPVVSTNLADSNSWGTAGITVTNLGPTNVNGVTLDRRQASVPTTDGTRKFLRLRATTSQ
jgi:hypothetical protein